MSSDRPRTAAWERVRERVRADAAAYREEGDTVIEVFADHGAVQQPPDHPVRFSFTVPGDTVSTLRQRVEDSSHLRTEVQYVDVDGTRLYVLDVHDDGTEQRILLAGGIGHRQLAQCPDADGPARTVVLSVTGTVALELHHGAAGPFLVDLE
jgi:hypothetical protein